MGQKTVLSEKAMQRMEKSIPELAGGAFKRAYHHALSTSGKVVEAANGKLVETSVDGTQRVIKSLPAPTPVQLGAKRIRSRVK
ncbi:MAG: hypothetical protein P4L87_22200 [Formivibrio sp.]|nr:hypothetical protein [Formivibrio sp.]